MRGIVASPTAWAVNVGLLLGLLLVPTITQTITLNETLNIAPGVRQGRKTRVGAWVIVSILNKIFKINLISMIATITRAQFSVPRRSGCECWVIVRVIVGEHQQ